MTYASGRVALTTLALAFALLACLAVASPPSASAEDHAKAAKAPEFPVGKWVPLFNGKDLTHWTPKIRYHKSGENFGNTFYVEDGLLKVQYDPKYYPEYGEKFGHIFYTARPFSHYRLRVEYRFVGEQCKGGPGWAFRNSGVMLHGQHPDTMGVDQDFPVSIEAQFLGGKGDGKKRTTSNLCTPGTNVVYKGGVFMRHCTNSSSKTYHGDQWVTVEFEVRGDQTIDHLIDGKSVLRYEKPQYDPRSADARKLIKDPNNLLIKGGYLSFQSESHPVHFRKIDVMVLE